MFGQLFVGIKCSNTNALKLFNKIIASFIQEANRNNIIYNEYTSFKLA